MGNHIAVTEKGKHVIGKKLFLTDENGVFKKGKKAFRTKDGAHRLVFSAGNDWGKYSCNYVPAHYVEKGAGGAASDTVWTQSITLYSDYQFSEAGGYSGIGAATWSYGEDLTDVDKLGMYWVENDRVVKVTSLSEASNEGFFDYAGDVVAHCEMVADAYSKGSTPYGTIFADEGELPEAGTLIEGSGADGYCVLKISGAYYYYVIE